MTVAVRRRTRDPRRPRASRRSLVRGLNLIAVLALLYGCSDGGTASETANEPTLAAATTPTTPAGRADTAGNASPTPAPPADTSPPVDTSPPADMAAPVAPSASEHTLELGIFAPCDVPEPPPDAAPQTTAISRFLSQDILVLGCVNPNADGPHIYLGWNLISQEIIWSATVEGNVENGVELNDFFVLSHVIHKSADGLNPAMTTYLNTAIDFASGTILWQKEAPPATAGAYGAFAGTNVLVANDTTVFAYDRAGNTVWEAPYNFGVTGNIRFSDNGAIVGLMTDDGVSGGNYAVTLYDVATGTPLRTMPEGGTLIEFAPTVIEDGADTATDIRTGAPVDATDRPFLDGVLRENDETLDFVGLDGVIRWSIPMTVIDHFVVAANRLFVRNYSEQVIVVNSADGTEVGRVDEFPAGSNDRWLIFDNDSSLRCVPSPRP